MYEYDYPMPALTADILLIHADRVLLIKRRNPPYEGFWALPGGFCEPGERVEDSAKRELLEETNVQGIEPMLLAVYSTPGRDPRGWTVSVAFTAKLPENACPKAGDDAKETQWFTLIGTKKGIELKGAEETLHINADGSSSRLAFDHGQMLMDYLRTR